MGCSDAIEIMIPRHLQFTVSGEGRELLVDSTLLCMKKSEVYLEGVSQSRHDPFKISNVSYQII